MQGLTASLELHVCREEIGLNPPRRGVLRAADWRRENRGASPSSGAGFVDHFFPDAFGLEDEFDEFAGGAFAAIGFGVVKWAARRTSGVAL